MPRYRSLTLASCLLVLVPACNSRDQSAADPKRAGVTSTAESTPDWSLEKRDREYLWELEHYSNVLVKHGFGRIVAALKERDYDDLTELISEGFTGTHFDEPSETVLVNQVLSAKRRSGDGKHAAAIDRQDLLAFFSEHRGRFGEDLKIRFDVKTISPLERNDLAGQWTALCVMRIWGDRGESEPGETSIVFNAKFESPTKERMAEPGWLLEFSIEQVATTTAS